MKNSEIERVEKLSVLKIISIRGEGTEADPVRPVESYWTMESDNKLCKKLVEFDPITVERQFQHQQQ